MKHPIAACIAFLALSAAQAAANEQITDQAMLAAFQAAINGQGFTCPTINGATRLDYEDEHGRMFLVVCSSEKYRHDYRISVNPSGFAFVRPRW